MRMRTLTVVTVLAAALATAASAPALTIGFGTPTPLTIKTGQETVVPILLTDIPANLGTVSFYVSYDAALLSLDEFPPPNGIPTFAPGVFGQQSTADPGFLNVFADVSGVSSFLEPFLLTELNFLGIGVGTSALSFASDANHLVFADLTDGTPQSVVLGAATSANVVPEPGTMVLLGSGLLGLAGYGRTRKPR